MNTVDDIDGWLQSIGRDIGHELALDEDGRCGFTFGDSLVGVVSVPEGSDDVLFSCAVAMLPAEDKELMMERILQLNLYGTATGGGSLGLESETGEIVLAQRWPWVMVKPESFSTMLGNFIALAAQLKRSLSLETTGTEPVQADTEHDLLSSLQWRV